MDLVNKRIAVFFYDGKQVAKRTGVVKNVDDNFLYINSEELRKVEAINKKNIVRFVVIE